MKRVKSVKRHSVIIRLALLVFVVYLMVSMFRLQSQLSDLNKELAGKTASLESINLKNRELKNLLESGSERDMIERAARDRLGYVYRGELVFKQK